jgi:hypothetical protein
LPFQIPQRNLPAQLPHLSLPFMRSGPEASPVFRQKTPPSRAKSLQIQPFKSILHLTWLILSKLSPANPHHPCSQSRSQARFSGQRIDFFEPLGQTFAPRSRTSQANFCRSNVTSQTNFG